MTTFFKSTKNWMTQRKSYSAATNSETLADAKEKIKNLSEEAALKVLLNVIEVMKCKVCKFVISLPMVSNVEGEVVCEACTFANFNSPLSPTEESILTSVILALPRECRYKGCHCVIVPGDDHKVWCSFQETSCKLCDWVGAARYIVSHAKSSHQLLEPCGTGESVISKELENFDPNEEHNAFAPVVVENVFLWAVTIVDTNGKEFRSNYIPVPNGKHTTKVSVEIVFGDDCFNNINSIKKELNLNPLYSTSAKNAIVFPTTVLSDYVDKNKVLQWKEVFTVEVP